MSKYNQTSFQILIFSLFFRLSVINEAFEKLLSAMEERPKFSVRILRAWDTRFFSLK